MVSHWEANSRFLESLWGIGLRASKDRRQLGASNTRSTGTDLKIHLYLLHRVPCCAEDTETFSHKRKKTQNTQIVYAVQSYFLKSQTKESVLKGQEKVLQSNPSLEP